MPKRRAIVTSLAISLLVTAGTGRAAGQTDYGTTLASLVEAERAFSRASEEKGIREAFLTWLAPEAVVFRPGPVEGRPVYEKMDPANAAVLTWEPEVAEVSAAGDLGYTSGPYVLRPARGAGPTSFGHYVSVWKRQPDGLWKVLLDIGVQYPRPQVTTPGGRIETPAPGKNAEPLSPEGLRDEEYAFGQRAGSIIAEAGAQGLRKVLAEFAADDIRIYRPGKLPAAGRSRIKELIPLNAGRVAGGTKGRKGSYQIGIAWSGDLAYSYGTTDLSKARTAAETTSFLRIWRKDASGTWKICLDIELPVPAEMPKAG